MNILITGSNGQLGSEIKDLEYSYKTHKFIFKNSLELDICSFDKLQNFIVVNEIDAVINCAAYTSVDKAEEEEIVARNVNSIGVKNIVKALKEVNGKLIHISTDYVFNGDSYLPYVETDRVNPIGVYGITKREGEIAVLNSSIDAIIVRTSWLYSSYGNNFVKTMLRLGNEKKDLGVIFDQVGTPTYARDLAKTCLDILSNKNLKKISANGKTYHFSNEGVASWYDFATAIMKLGELNCVVKPIQTKEYPTLAKRPHFSVLNKMKIKKDFEIEIPYWRNSLADCISKLNNK